MHSLHYLFDIVLEGSMRRKDLEKVLEWAKAHKKEIEDEWQRING